MFRITNDKLQMTTGDTSNQGYLMMGALQIIGLRYEFL